MLSFPLRLTSPLTKGALVKEAQGRLAKSRFGNFHPGDVDGEFGEHSAAAVHRAKYWLGYPTDQINEAYGGALHAYLGGKALPLTYQARRKLRLKKQADRPLRLKVLAKAISQIGETEHPANSNISKFSKWYGVTGPWCAMFVSWCIDQCGGKFHYAYCPFILRDARAGVNGLRILKASEVKPGDGVLYDWEHNGVPDHVGFFERGNPSGAFVAVEGNTAVGNNSNGGIVMRRADRVASEVAAFFRYEV